MKKCKTCKHKVSYKSVARLRWCKLRKCKVYDNWEACEDHDGEL